MKPASSAGMSPARLSPARGVSRGLGRAWEIAKLVGLVLGGAAIFAFLVVLDAQLVANVYERSQASTLPALVAGAAAAVVTVLGFVWYRTRADRLGATARRMLGAAGWALSVLFIIAFIWTHSVSRDAEDAGPPKAGVVTYLLLVIVAAVAFGLIAAVRQARPKPHRPDDRIRVWSISDKQPYFIAYCDCEWVGPPHDADEPHAKDNAFRDAHRHGTNVAPEVEDPLA